MDKLTASQLTGLTCREFPEATFEFMRCQIGKTVPTMVKLSAYKSVNENVFHLRAYGTNWDEALDMFDRLKG